MHVSIIIIITYKYFYNFYMLEKRWICIENAYIFVFLFYPPFFWLLPFFMQRFTYLFIYVIFPYKINS